MFSTQSFVGCILWYSIVSVFSNTQLPDGYEESPFDDELNWGRRMPKWPDGFGDRLEVIKFNYTKNAKTVVMYVLSVVEDEVALHPSEFGENAHVPAIRKLIEDKYVDRVIPDVGLGIALYDILKVRDAYIFPGDLKDSQGDAACTVVFRMIVFRPKVGELLIGRVLASTPMGLHVTLGFFQDVSIPIAHLRKPCQYDERSKSWLWNYESDPGAIPIPYPYLPDELICLRVKSVQFLDSVDESLSSARRAQALSKQEESSKVPAGQFAHDVQTEHPPMLVVGSVEEDGMGLKNWWI